MESVLPREQCWRHLATAHVGRVIFTRQAMPAVELVTYTVDAGDIVIAAPASGELAAAIDGAVVAFEVDEFSGDNGKGWEVTAVGEARAVADAADVARLRIVEPWGRGERPSFLRITPGTLNGHWLPRPG